MTAEPRHMEIASYWRNRILVEEMKPGGGFPSRGELMELHNAARATIDKAVKVLQSENLITTSQGRPTRVAHRVRIENPAGAVRVRRTGNGSALQVPGETCTDHGAQLKTCADHEIAQALGVGPHDDVVAWTRTFLYEDKPSVLSASLVHTRALEAVPELLNQGELPEGWQTAYRRRTGRSITPSPEVRGARMLRREEAEAFGLDPQGRHAALVLQRVFHDDEGPLEHREDVYAPGLWQEGG